VAGVLITVTMRVQRVEQSPSSLVERGFSAVGGDFVSRHILRALANIVPLAEIGNDHRFQRDGFSKRVVGGGWA
jgi:hypothetical protein